MRRALGISLARLIHSCVQDALLDMGNGSLYTVTGVVLTLTGMMSQLKALHISTSGFASGGA